MKFLNALGNIKIFGKKEFNLDQKCSDHVSSSDDVLCVALPRNLDKCFAQLIGAVGRVDFCDKAAFASGSYRARYGGAGSIVVSAAVVEDVVDQIDYLRSVGTAVHVAVWAPLNDFMRSQDACDPTDFWSGHLIRIPSTGDLSTFLADLRCAPCRYTVADNDAAAGPGWHERLRNFSSSLEDLASQHVSLISGFARSHGESYRKVLAEMLPERTDFDLVVLSSRCKRDRNGAIAEWIEADIKMTSGDRSLLFVSFGSWNKTACLDGFGLDRAEDRIRVINVPPCVFYEAAGTVYSDDPHVCAESALHGKATRLIGQSAPGGKTIGADAAGAQIARQMLRPQTCIFDCATQTFVSAEKLLEKFSALNVEDPVADHGSYVDAQAAAVWSERVFMLGQANYLAQAIILSDFLSGFHPGANIGVGPIHTTNALHYLAGHSKEIERSLSATDDFGTFDRHLPIILYSYFNEGAFNRLQNVSNAFVRECIKRVQSRLTVRTLKRLERSLNCLYELDQLLASFGQSCLDEHSRVALIDLLYSLFANWAKLPNVQRSPTRTLSNAVIKVLHREDFDIPHELIALIIRHNRNELAYLVSLLNLVNNNEVITQRNMSGRERIMSDLADNLATQFMRLNWQGKTDAGFWTALISFVAVGYDCDAIRSGEFVELEKLMGEHLAGGSAAVEAALPRSGAAKPLSRYIRALEQLATANAPVSAAACDMLHEASEIAAVRFKANALIQQDLVRIGIRMCKFSKVDERLQVAARGEFRMNWHVRRMASDHLFAQGRMDEGLEQLDRAEVIFRNNLLKSGDTPSIFKQLHDLTQDRERKTFYKSCAELLSKVPQPTKPKGVIFILPYDAQNTMAMGVPVLGELRKRSYATVYLGTGILPKEPTGLDEIDKYHGIISYNYTTLSDEPYYDRTLKNDWKIDWKNKVLECDGINYFQGVFEYLANCYRRFDIDIEQAPIWKFFYTQLLKCDRAVSVCKSIQANPVLKDLPVRFMAVSAQTSPSYIFKEYCAEVGYRDDMHLVFHINGYENYFSNLGTKVASTMGVRDMTVRPFIRSPLIVRRDMLEQPADSEVEKERLKSVLTADRVGVTDLTPVVAAVEKRIRDHRAGGGKVVVCYGKVLCDLGVPYDGGPAHHDILDWLNHTIDCARDSDTLLLVKPHPHELRPEIARHLTQTLCEGISVEIPDNVILLGHDWFNNSKLKDMMDVAILWNGTSCLEMSVWGLPVVICAHFGTIDYPVDLIAPQSRADYERMIRDPDSLKQHPDNAGLAIDYLQKMGSDAVFSPYRYCPRPATNDPVGPYYWIREDIERWQGSGDPSVERMADEYVREFVPGESGVATEGDYERYRAFKRGHETAV
ncbi:hypothetical protein [Labrenzia sp. OB1]|uniref:hypothetical protein n=1 Tax=Labrenzia sp. OB1 TaxID=1561204 RepID=UPI0007B1A2F0|nr:hypothetical protein [Labrenzia sp. OB1]KZM49941.1 hypothetical protein OA90_10980 [Labrenzia sp. OB1]